MAEIPYVGWLMPETYSTPRIRLGAIERTRYQNVEPERFYRALRGGHPVLISGHSIVFR